jgi:ADP-ribosylglycohydrolase
MELFATSAAVFNNLGVYAGRWRRRPIAVSCQGSVPQALIAFLGSTDYEDAVRKAVSLGGDSDTIACIAGGIAQAYYRVVPDAIQEGAFALLDEPLAEIVREFAARYGCDGKG